MSNNCLYHGIHNTYMINNTSTKISSTWQICSSSIHQGFSESCLKLVNLNKKNPIEVYGRHIPLLNFSCLRANRQITVKKGITSWALPWGICTAQKKNTVQRVKILLMWLFVTLKIHKSSK